MELISELRTLLKGGNLRSGRQLEETEEMVSERLERQRLGGFEECTLVGFEFKRGEECEEVKEIDCYPVNVTKFTTELRDKCETIVDRHCELVTVQIPEQICKPIYKTRYSQSDIVRSLLISSSRLVVRRIMILSKKMFIKKSVGLSMTQLVTRNITRMSNIEDTAGG